MVVPIVSSLANFVRKLGGLTFIIILLNIILFMRVDQIYGTYAPIAEKMLIVYFFITLSFFALYDKKLPSISFTATNLAMFILAFTVTVAVVYLIQSFGQPVAGIVASTATLKLALGFGLLHGIVAVFNEEIVFRYVIPSIVGDSLMAGVWSSLLFGILHFGLRGVGILGVAVLSMLGFIWYIAKRSFGLTAAMGSHYAWNLGAYGALSKLI
jgi:membrane protease YdiL (CAAX protease family)